MPKLRSRQIDMIAGQLVDRVVVTAFLPGRADAKLLAEGRDFRPAVMPPTWDRRQRMKSIHRLAINGSHSRGCVNSSPIAMGVDISARICLNQARCSGGRNVFQEEQPEPFHPLGKVQCQGWIEVLVHVVQELHLPAQRVP